jgi:transposase
MEIACLMAEQGKQELKTQFVELRAKGLSYAAIAKRLEVHY